MTNENPLTGVGAGAFGASFEQVLGSILPIYQSPHNDYLLVLSQLGIMGLVLFGLHPYLFYTKHGTDGTEPHLLRLQDKQGIRVPTIRFFSL